MGLPLRRSAGATSGSLELPIDEWPFLDQTVLVRSRSRKVCMTCHWCGQHSGVTCIPLLTCKLHQGLLAQSSRVVSTWQRPPVAGGVQLNQLCPSSRIRCQKALLRPWPEWIAAM